MPTGGSTLVIAVHTAAIDSIDDIILPPTQR